MFLFGVFGVLAGVLAFYLAYLFLKKVHRLEKSTLPPAVASVTNTSYVCTKIEDLKKDTLNREKSVSSAFSGRWDNLAVPVTLLNMVIRGEGGKCY